MENKLTEQESLNLINEMIVQTRGNIQKGSTNVMIFAGYSVAIISVLNFIFLHLMQLPFKSFWIWLLMIPMTIVCFMMSAKKKKSAIVKTHIDAIVSKVWFAFFVSIVVFLIIIFSVLFVFKAPVVTVLITPIILIMLGASQYVTAVATRFSPFFKGAYLFWLGAVLCIFMYSITRMNIQFLILAICMIVGFVLPGYALNNKANDNV